MLGPDELRRWAWRRWPLWLRLVVVIFATEIIVSMPLSFVWGFIGGISPGLIEYYATQPDFRSSLRPLSEGRTGLAPNADLRRRLNENPTLKVGAIELASGDLVEGSAPAFMELFAAMRRGGIVYSDFFTDTVSTPAGRCLAVYYATRWDVGDLARALWRMARATTPSLLLVGLPMSIATTWVTWLTFRPVRAAAAAVDTLSLSRLEARVPDQAMPVEMIAFAAGT